MAVEPVAEEDFSHGMKCIEGWSYVVSPDFADDEFGALIAVGGIKDATEVDNEIATQEGIVMISDWALDLVNKLDEEFDKFDAPFLIGVAARDPQARELIMEDPAAALKILRDIGDKDA